MARPGLTQHRKFRRLERVLNSHIVARGVLETMWDVCYQNGDPFLGDSDDVEAAAHWDGEPGKLTKALLEAGGGLGPGFIEEAPGRSGQYQMHDLYHHAPDYVRKRRTREEERRAKTDPVRNAAVSDQSVTGHRQPSPSCQTGVSLSSQSGVDRTPAPAPAPAPIKESISSNAEASDHTQSRDPKFEAGLKEVWQYYLAATDRNSKTYEFTKLRRQKGAIRLNECLRKTGGDLEKAVGLMKLAVDGLAASDFHMGRDAKTNGKSYREWEKHLFGSFEKMEYWWNQAESASPGSNGHAHLSFNQEAC